MRTTVGTAVGSVQQALQSLRTAVQAFGELDIEDLDDTAAAEVYSQVQALGDQLHAIGLRALPVVESGGLWALEGHRTAAGWVAQRTRVSLAAARRELRLARALREELPGTATAVRDGTLGLEHARVLATVAATSPTRREALTDPDSPTNEDFLLHHARTLPVDPFRSLTRRWAAAADPDTDERGYRAALDREFLQLSPTLGGYHLAGYLTHEHGTTLSTALTALTPPHTPQDTRTTAQRRAGALHALARTTLDHDLTTGSGTGVRPHLNIHVDAETLAPTWATRLRAADANGTTDPARPATAGDRRATTRAGNASSGTAGAGTTADAATTAKAATTPGNPAAPQALPGPATYDDGTPLPLTLLRRLACDSQTTRILLGPGSILLDVGRTARTVTGQLRRAVITRDRHCAYPGCHTPPERCEIHHPHHWADGGPTSLTNSVLLCWHHHEHVHTTGTTITAAGTRTGPETRTGTESAAEAGLHHHDTHPAATLHPHWTFHDRHGRPVSHDAAPSRPPP
nr:HNH endonuclease signature motif containing protein [uncultured Actinotalea sp.]